MKIEQPSEQSPTHTGTGPWVKDGLDFPAAASAGPTDLIRDGTTLVEAATVLGNAAGIPAGEVTAALRVVGFVDQVLALGEVIRTLCAAKERLHALRLALPNLPQIFSAFELIGSLDHLLCEPAKPQDPPSGRFRLGNRTAEGNFLQWLFLHYPPHKDLTQLANEHPLKLDVLVVWWLYGSTVRLYGNQIPEWRVEYLTDWFTPGSDVEILEALVEAVPGTEAINAGVAAAGTSAWLDQINALSKLRQTVRFGDWHKLSRGNEIQLPLALERLSKVQEGSLAWFSDLESISPEISVPTLSERELLTAHWYFPRPAELVALQEFLKRNSKPEAPAYTEACLLGLAIFSSRSVQSVLQWRIYQRLADAPFVDRIQWTKQISHSTNAEFTAPAWHKNEHGPRKAKAALVPNFYISQWLGKLDVGLGSPRLLDLLPLSETDWATRAYACLAKVLQCSVVRAALLTRDLIPRLVYHDTANSALAKFWRSSASDRLGRDDRIALSHYVEIGHGRALTSFVKAGKVVFGNTSMSVYHELRIPLHRPALKSSESRTITKALQTSLRDAESAVDTHNCAANLVLFVCIAGTGHRRRTSPFPFPWDFNIAERLVFIADKLITGSEARFVPLAPTVIQYLEYYANHLQKLSLSAEVSPAVRSYARSVASFLSTTKTPATYAIEERTAFKYGVFFTISPDGNQIQQRTISTHQLDLEIRRLTRFDRVVQRLRPALASSCWEAQASGRSVQNLLGHQPELHSHGPASTWSIRGWADELEPLIETYLRDYGFGFEKSPPPPRGPKYLTGGTVPLAISSELGYEGRQREKKWAEQRARVLIKREIHEHILLDDPTNITEEDVQRIKATVLTELHYDPAGMTQVSAELGRQLALVRRRKDVTVSDRHSHLHAMDPGPIGIEFSRALRVAGVFRQVWERNVGVAIGAHEFDRLERLAHLAISLVCLDSVLLPLHVQGIVESVATVSPTCHSTGMTLRSRILSATHDYDFSMQPGLVTSALAYGVKRPHSFDPEKLWDEVETRIGRILRKLLNINGSADWSLRKLCLAFRPYWLIRLPGAMYAVAIGDYRGPAADPLSEAQLLGAPTEVLANKLERLPIGCRKKESPTLSAYQDLRRLFSEARGNLEKGEHKKKMQRSALREALISSEHAFAITKWGSETQIVELLFSFIGCLLDKGGKRVKTLAFSSLEKYFSLVAKEMIALAWKTDFEAIGREELTELLETASSRLSDKAANTVLAYFASHLRDEIGAPYCGPKWSNPKDLVRIRSSLIPSRQLSKATNLLLKDGDHVSRDAALLITTMSGYGLRNAEAWGLAANSFDPVRSSLLTVRLTRIADLKSHSGRRILAGSLNAKSMQAVVAQGVARATTSPHQGRFLFEDSTGNALISKTRATSHEATVALRLGTNNPIAVPYHLRHTYGTALILGIFALQNKGLHDVTTRLLGSDYERRISDIFQIPSNWPFAVDFAGALMGHIGVTDILNTYGHASCFIIAAWCRPWQCAGVMTDIRLGALINRERSQVTRMRQRQQQLLSDDQEAMIGWHKVIQHLIQQPATEETNQNLAPEDELVQTGMSNSELAWVMVPRMLLDRLRSGVSFDEMIDYAARAFGAPAATLAKMLDRYKELVITTEFDDFEPSTSELLKPTPSHNRGIDRGRLERDKFLARAQKWLLDNPKHQEVFGEFLARWELRVNAQNPRIVCLNQRELEQSIFVLTSLGCAASQLKLETHGDPSHQWLEQVILANEGVKQSPNRASRGSHKVLVKEVSIFVQQRTAQGFPDGRDLHRALMSLNVAWHTSAYPAPR